MTQDEVTDIKIYKTRDYDKFNLFYYNRKVSLNTELANSILSLNKLKFNPIVVTPDFYIIDGQHRFNIAKEYELDLYYIIDSNSEEREIQSLNVGTRVWTCEDHMAFFSKLGVENYKFLNHCCKNYPISVSQLVKMFCDNVQTTRNRTKIFKSGNITFKHDKEDILKFLDCYKSVYDYYTVLKKVERLNSRFQLVLMQLITHPEYDHDRMMKAVMTYPDALLRCNQFSSKENIRATLMDDIYNKRRKEDNVLHL